MTLLDPHLDVDQLSAAVDGERDPAVAAHLLACLSCRRQVETWRRTLATLRDAPTAAPDVGPLIDGAMAGWTPPPPSRSDVRPAVPIRAQASGRAGDLVRRLQPPPSVAAVLVVAVLIAVAVVGIRHNGGGATTSSATSSAAAPAPRAPATHSLQSAAASSGVSSAAVPSAISFAGPARLAAELRRVATVSSTVDVATPCYDQAKRLAGRNPAVASASPTYSEAVRLAGVDGRVFVFAGVHAHVGIVVGAGSCSLLATVVF